MREESKRTTRPADATKESPPSWDCPRQDVTETDTTLGLPPLATYATRVVVVGMVVVTLVVAPLAAVAPAVAAQPAFGGPPTGIDREVASGTCAEADAATATQAEADARRLASDLRGLAAAHPGLVPQERLTGVNRSIESGAAELDLGQYEQACQAFTTAADQARGALRTYYPRATRANLDAAEQVIDHEGADDPARASALRARHDRVANKVGDATSVSEHARLYDQSETLLADARALQPTLLERVLAALPLGVTALLCLSLIVVLVQYLRGGGRGGSGLDPSRIR